MNGANDSLGEMFARIQANKMLKGSSEAEISRYPSRAQKRSSQSEIEVRI
jgi:hypothetical protein